MDKRLLDVLCCPVTKAPLRPLARDELDALNRAIAAGGLVTLSGSPVARTFDSALVTRDGRRIYRVDDDIPVMLADEAIDSSRVDAWPAS